MSTKSPEVVACDSTKNISLPESTVPTISNKDEGTDHFDPPQSDARSTKSMEESHTTEDTFTINETTKLFDETSDEPQSAGEVTEGKLNCVLKTS